jgi:hypothetical protein
LLPIINGGILLMTLFRSLLRCVIVRGLMIAMTVLISLTGASSYVKFILPVVTDSWDSGRFDGSKVFISRRLRIICCWTRIGVLYLPWGNSLLTTILRFNVSAAFDRSYSRSS